MKLSLHRWTVVAMRGDAQTRSGWVVNKWFWIPGQSETEIFAASMNDDVIVMHSHAPDGVLLMARLAGPAWKRWRRQCERKGKIGAAGRR